VTASPFGFNAIGPMTVRQPDGTDRSVSPEPSDKEEISRSAMFRIDRPGVKVLHVTARAPELGDRVFIATPGAKGQAVLVGMAGDAVLDSQKRLLTFSLLLAPGTDLPLPGSPVLDELGWLIGVVAQTSVTNGVPNIQCEGADLLLHGGPPR